MSKITFLLGAGASANAMPVVEKIPERLEDFIRWIGDSQWQLSSTHFFPPTDNNQPMEKDRQQFIIDLTWLHEQSKNNRSIDTYAKKLFIQQQQGELIRLKAVLTAFFSLEQMRNSFDNRYDAFIGKLYRSDRTLLENVRVLTWNYDSQFERAMSVYAGGACLDDCRIKLNLNPSKGFQDTNCFSIFQLNGTTDIIETDPKVPYYNPISELNIEIDVEMVRKVISIYRLIKLGVRPSLLNFAWESSNNSHISMIHETAIRHTIDTNVLVVIGYSFPFFNKEIDQQIIGGMRNLRKVYIQDLTPEAGRKKFEGIYKNTQNIVFETIKEVDEFLIPTEM